MVDLAWLAGLIEGEGCVPRSTNLCLVVAMTDQDVIEKLYAIADVGRMNGPYPRKTPGGAPAKPIWRWEARGSDAAGLLMTLYPMMCSRRQERIREALLLWRASPGKGNHNRPTHCKRGHALTPDNVQVKTSGPKGRYKRRQCLACKRDESRRYRAAAAKAAT